MDNKGFTLIEMLVVAGIIGLLSTFMIINFSRSRLNLDETVSVFVSDIRSAQTNAISSTKFSGYNPCGYGVRYLGPNQYAIYVGPDASANNCDSIGKNYQSGRDYILTTRTFSDSRVQFSSSFNDIFFRPPDPKTFLNNDSSLSLPPEVIIIGKAGGSCPGECKSVYIYTSGKIEIQ